MIPASTLIGSISSGDLDTKILTIDPDASRLDYERDRYIKAIRQFTAAFGDNEVSIFSAPGRSELIGNHTDHQHGKVLACSINRDAIAVASPRNDSIVRVKSGDHPVLEFDSSNLEMDESLCGTTLSLIRGVMRGIADRGYKTGGFNAYVTSDVLIGAGLSSSAAFETVIGAIVNGFYNDMAISAVDIAKIGQFAENVHFGKPCGLMDQMACSVGSLVNIDFADPENPVIRQVELDLAKYGMSLCITDTKGSHSNLTADYAAVPAEMKSVANFFGKEYLNDVDEEEFISKIDIVRKKHGDRAVLRALHYFDENRRVDSAVSALSDGDIDAFLACIKASGDSSFKYLQNVYTNHDVVHQNVSLALCMSDRALAGGKGVSRVHGGGFAGTIQAFVKDEAVKEYASSMDQVFGRGACSVLKIRRFGGIRVV